MDSAQESVTSADKSGVTEKLPVRERIALLVDKDSLVEDGLRAHSSEEGYPADGVVTGSATIDSRPVLLVANDSTVKAGSWGARTVEKMIRITERALTEEIPIVWLIDSAGARITDQVELFPGRRGAGRIFYNQVRLSGRVPQVCVLMGPSAAGGAYIPAFCDVVIMVEGTASMYLGSPRMAQMVIGENISLEEMGGARMHATISGCGDNLVSSEEEGLAQARELLSYLPTNWHSNAPEGSPKGSGTQFTSELLPAEEKVGYDVHSIINAVVDADSFFEIKPLFAKEIVIGLSRLDGKVVGVVANNPSEKGGVLFGDSADKAARFIWYCDAFNIPLLFLADVPGFMIGSQVEKQGIIRHGAKLITAVSEATVPKISVIMRKAYGAGLYAMAGPAFGSDAVLALPTAKIAVMGPEAAINAVYAKRLETMEAAEKEEFIRKKIAEYEQDIDLQRLASDLVIDDIVYPEDLRENLINRFASAANKDRNFTSRRHGVPPV